MTRICLWIGTAGIASSLLWGCRQTAARLELTDRRPEPATNGTDSDEAPLVRVISGPTRQPTAAAESLSRPSAEHEPAAGPRERVILPHVGDRLAQPSIDRGSTPADSRPQIVSAAFHQPGPASDKAQPRTPLEVPADIPGAAVPDLRLPPLDPNEPMEERREAIRDLYQAIPELPEERVIAATPDEHPLTLLELQHTAYSRSPVINRAWAEIDAARGRAIQAGLCPNPVVGYQGDTINTLGTAGYNGLFFEQTYITCGKLALAQQAALMEVRAAEYAYRRARVQVATAVRTAYFDVLMAQERVRLARAMSTLTQEAYNAQIDLVAGGQAAAYEPLQLKVTALRARNAVVTAENAYQGAWRELAAALNEPTMLPIALAGSVETRTGALNFDAARSAMLSRHTDLSIAQAQVAQQNFNLELQRRMPIPNLELYSAIQHDDTNSRNDVSYNVQVGLPLPLFNRNQGNISAANAELVRAQHNRISTQNDLSTRLAEAYARYVTARELAETYRTQIVPSQVQTFRGVHTRFRTAGDVDFAQVIVSQQTLAEVLREYLDTLSEEWGAAVDVAEILQVQDVYTMDGLVSPPQLEPVPAE